MVTVSSLSSALFVKTPPFSHLYPSLKSEKYSLTSSGYSVPNDETNIIFKAYQAIKPTKVNNEFSIILQKNIPIGSGLGGGSSNAATTLKTLNKLWNLNYSNKKLLIQNKGQFECIQSFKRAITYNEPTPIPFDEIYEVSKVTLKIEEMIKNYS